MEEYEIIFSVGLKWSLCGYNTYNTNYSRKEDDRVDILKKAVSDIRKQTASREAILAKKKKDEEVKYEYPEVDEKYYAPRAYTQERIRVIELSLEFTRKTYDYSIEVYKSERSKLTFAQQTELIKQVRSGNPDLSSLPYSFRAAHLRASLAKRAYLVAIDEYTVAHWWRNDSSTRVAERKAQLEARGMRL